MQANGLHHGHPTFLFGLQFFVSLDAGGGGKGGTGGGAHFAALLPLLDYF
jgi:hypothetical protein